MVFTLKVSILQAFSTNHGSYPSYEPKHAFNRILVVSILLHVCSKFLHYSLHQIIACTLLISSFACLHLYGHLGDAFHSKETMGLNVSAISSERPYYLMYDVSEQISCNICYNKPIHIPIFYQFKSSKLVEFEGFNPLVLEFIRYLALFCSS